MQNSAHILCLIEADAFFCPNDEKSRELIKTFIRFGHKGIVIKQWSSRPIDDRHITRHPSISHGAAREDLQNEIMPLVIVPMRCDHRRRQQISEHLQQTPARLQSGQRSREHPHESISETVE